MRSRRPESHRLFRVRLLAAVGGLAASAAGFTMGSASATSLSNGEVLPSGWSNPTGVAVIWRLRDPQPSLRGPVIVSIAPSVGAPGRILMTVPGPFDAGFNGPHIADARHVPEGVHRVNLHLPDRGSLEIGTLRIDRTSPTLSVEEVTSPLGEAISVGLRHHDALAGIDTRDGVDLAFLPEGASDDTAWTPLPTTTPPLDFRGQDAAPHWEYAPIADEVAEGPIQLRVRVRDRAGNETSQVQRVVIDRTPPELTVRQAESGNPLTGEVEVHASAIDTPGGTGIAQLTLDANPDQVRIDGRQSWVDGPTRRGNYRIRMFRRTPTDVVVHATDIAGHTTSRTLTLRWPTPPPAHDPAQLPETEETGSATPPATADHAPAPTGPVGSAAPSIGPGGPSGSILLPSPLERLVTTPTRAGAPAGPGVRRSWQRLRTMHRARARLPLAGSPRVARTPAQWRTALGGPRWARIHGYTTRSGRVYIGPTATASLEQLERARHRELGGPGPRPTRAQADRWVHGLAVLLHESLHATGAQMDRAHTMTAADRALEEGLTEAATVDLLDRAVRALALPTRMRAPMRAAAGRYRPGYPAQVRWVRQLSARATGRAATSARAQTWRVNAADTLGHDRWQRLASQLGPNAHRLLSGVPLNLRH